MREEVEKFVQNNEIMKRFLKYQNNELKVIRNIFNSNLIEFYNEKDKDIRNVKICGGYNYDFLEYMVAFKCKIDLGEVSILDSIKRLKESNKCLYCNSQDCMKKNAILIYEEVKKYNENNTANINYVEVIDYILNTKTTEYKSVPDATFYKNVDIIDLLYIQTILEMDLINIKEVQENLVKIDYLDMTEKENDTYYINILTTFYKNGQNAKHLTLDLSNKDDIFKEKNDIERRYKIAAYYKYLIEYEKANIILSLGKIAKTTNTVNKIQIRSRYFIKRYFQKVEALPYSRKTKEKIYNILNYILNYKYKGSIPYIPINMLIYSNDKEGVEKISRIIGEFMWYFLYLNENMKYYNEYMNDIILDKYKIKKLYYESDKDNIKRKNGIMILHGVENLFYMENKSQNVILNILTDEMENNKQVCTIIYGNRTKLNRLLNGQKKLSNLLINLELEIDDLDIEKIHELTVNKLRENVYVSNEVNRKIFNYIKATYNQSEFKNMEYIKKLYNDIILNMNNKYLEKEKLTLKPENIPEIYNVKELPTVMKDFDNLVGLSDIKEQINDLVSLLKFKQKTNIGIKDFNLHMCFLGNPGTGKTTVGRIITDIFFNLGYINQNKLTEVTARDLIAEYIGQTSGKTYNVVKSALGGILFIDEAYAITNGKGEGARFGNECIATLLKLMEDYKDKLIIVFAGYDEEMEEFLGSNPGLTSRIGYKIKFPDYSTEELIQIFLNLLHENNMDITKSALTKLENIIKISSKNKNFGNGRYIHNIFQKILIEHAKNIEKQDMNENLFLIDDVFLITEEDINYDKLIFETKGKKIGF